VIAFRWHNEVKRICQVRGVDVGVGVDLFQTGIFNTEVFSKYPNDCITELYFDDLPDIIQARVTMFTLAKDEWYIEGVGLNGLNVPSHMVKHNFMYIYEEE